MSSNTLPAHAPTAARQPAVRSFNLKAAALALVVSAAPVGTMVGLGAAHAASQTISGEVTDVFGRKFVLATSSGNLLVSSPYAITGVAKGHAYRVTGERDGSEMSAEKIEPVQDTATHAASTDSVFPPELRGLGLALTGGRDTPYGIREIFARLPDGTRIEADIERRGHVSEIKAMDDGAALPRALVERFVPSGAGTAQLASLARVHEIDVADNGRITVDGYARDGKEFRTDLESAGNGAAPTPAR